MSNGVWGRMFKTSILYTFGIVIAKLTTFLLLPLYTDKVSTEDYGTYDLVIAYSAILVPLVGVNSWQGMLRFIIEEKDILQRHRIVSHGWLMLIYSALALAVGYTIICLSFEFEHKFLIFLCFFFQLLQYFYLYSSRGFNRNKIYACSGIVSSISVAIVTIICVYSFNLKLEALYLSLIVSLVAQILYMEYYLCLRKDINFKYINRNKLKEIYKYCIPESVSTVFNWLLDNANRVIIVAVLGMSANGIYAISHKFIGILTVFTTAFVLSFQESIYSVERSRLEDVSNNVLRVIAKYIGFIVALVLLITSLIYPFFVKGEYREGYLLVPLFYAHFLISGITWILSSIVSATKKTQLTLYEKIVIGSINFLLMLFLIKPIGLSSSPVSLLVAECVGLYVFKYLLKKKAGVSVVIPINYILLNFVLLALVSVVYIFNNIVYVSSTIILLSSSAVVINKDKLNNVYCELRKKIKL